MYLEEVFPPDIYHRVLASLPPPELYVNASERYQTLGEPQYARMLFPLTTTYLARLSVAQQEFWRGITAALTAAELRQAIFTKLAHDLAFRYGVPESQVGMLAGYARPVLYRETEGFEIPPHPDTRRKVVTMQWYLPADRTQLGLGTALYRRKLLSWPFGSWHHRFVKIKQFAFQPNSAYAFVVNNTLGKKSWHGREKLPADAGVRNTLQSTFYERPRAGF